MNLSEIRVVKVAVVCLVLLAIAITATLTMQGRRGGKDVEINVSQKTLKLLFEVTNESNTAIKNPMFSMYLPVESDVQSYLNLKVSKPHVVMSDDGGNQVVETELGLIPPYGVSKLTFSFEVL